MLTDYLLGFKSLQTTYSNLSLNITGEIPPWLFGSLIRNGPALYHSTQEKMNHWFDGFAMLHRFSIAPKQIIYTNHFIESDAYQASIKTQKICYPEFATSPKKNIFEYLRHLFSPRLTDNTNVNVTLVAGKPLAMTETCRYNQFSPDSLLSHDFHFDDLLKGQITTAHPQYDNKRKCLYNFTIELGLPCYYHIFSIANDSKTRRLVSTLKIKSPAYMHSFAMTENYIILIESPLRLDTISLMLQRKPYIQNYQWDKTLSTTFKIIDKNNGTLVHEFETDAFFYFHQLNAFEKNGEIIIDLAAYSDARIIDTLYLKNLPLGNFPAAKPIRFIFKLDNQRFLQESLADCSLELPRINDITYNARNYRYTYAASAKKPGDFLNQLVKIDVQSGRSFIWREKNCYPGEPVFIAKPGSLIEDEGVILSVVMDAKLEHSFLLILDGQSFEEVARANVAHIIPFGFHGAFFYADASNPLQP